MKSSAVVVGRRTAGRAARALGRLTARSKRPLLATTTRSVTSRSTGLAGRWNEPQAQEPPAPARLVPHDLAPEQQAELVLQDRRSRRPTATGTACGRGWRR